MTTAVLELFAYPLYIVHFLPMVSLLLEVAVCPVKTLPLSSLP